jgi:uncharacterized Ntn-hydrolase superfamily protein
MTYSIVARDAETGDLGVAVQTRWFGVGSVVPWVEPGVGAVATQSWSEMAYGFHGLRLMRERRPAPDSLEALLADDPDEAVRQVGMVDAAGRAAAHTGLRCVRYASHLVAPGVAVQANMMERPTVPAAMLAAFRGTDGLLEHRLFAALLAAERQGGDVRGRQSAALVVARGDDSRRSAVGASAIDPSRPDPWSRRVDLRVEDHPAPLVELGRLLAVAAAYDAMDEAEQLALHDDAVAAEAALRRRRRCGGRSSSRRATTRSCCGARWAWRWRDG